MNCVYLLRQALFLATGEAMPPLPHLPLQLSKCPMPRIGHLPALASRLAQQQGLQMAGGQEEATIPAHVSRKLICSPTQDLEAGCWSLRQRRQQTATPTACLGRLLQHECHQILRQGGAAIHAAGICQLGQ